MGIKSGRWLIREKKHNRKIIRFERKKKRILPKAQRDPGAGNSGKKKKKARGICNAWGKEKVANGRNTKRTTL